MGHYQTLLDDMSNTLPYDAIEYPPPYDSHLTFDEKFELTKIALRRAKGTNDRILQLVNAFYLGQLLEIGTDSGRQRTQYAQRLTNHYRIVVKRVYYLFEIPGIRQIVRTTNTTLTTVRSISSSEYHDLLSEVSRIFNGVENLGGE